MKLFSSIVIFITVQLQLSAQQTYPVSDSMPAILNGLQAGFTITGASEKEVGNKGDFSRYKIRFFVTNTTTEAKILFWSARGDNFVRAGNSAPQVVRFVCLNATGARLTSKECSLSAATCNMEVIVEDKDPSGKIVQNRRMANLGYWIRPGETISSNTIMIVPLNERPVVNAIFFPVNNSFAASLPNSASMGYEGMVPPPGNAASPYGASPPAPGSQNTSTGARVVRFKNASTGTHLNSQNGFVSCAGYSGNNTDWRGAEWELIPVEGTNYVSIRDKMQHRFLSSDGPGMLTDNNRSRTAWWSIEQSYGSTMYRIRNAATSAILVFQHGAIAMDGNGNINDNSALWMIE
jgi:hypothetical protein